MIQTVAAWAFPLFLAGITLLPLVRSDYWTFRILEYPRLQKLGIGLLCIVILVVMRRAVGAAFPYLLVVAVACCIYQAVKIFPYTALAPKEMLRASAGGNQLRIFTANVLQTNEKYGRMLAQIRETDPDIIFLAETDERWATAMQELDGRYPFTIKQPLDNTYGLLFYSRLPLRHERLLFRTDPEVPSIEAEVALDGAGWIKLFGLHPKPPVPNESLYATAKDKELMKVAFEVKKEQKPCIVMGDLNDVAWSHVTQLFRKVSGLIDPRRGRGFYSTYSARNPLMRFPLDYIFCSAHFRLVQMRRMPYNGSDHFAMFIHLQHDPKAPTIQDTPKADSEEQQEAAEKASKPAP